MEDKQDNLKGANDHNNQICDHMYFPITMGIQPQAAQTQTHLYFQVAHEQALVPKTSYISATFTEDCTRDPTLPLITYLPFFFLPYPYLHQILSISFHFINILALWFDGIIP